MLEESQTVPAIQYTGTNHSQAERGIRQPETMAQREIQEQSHHTGRNQGMHHQPKRPHSQEVHGRYRRLQEATAGPGGKGRSAATRALGQQV
jgi:hypothetical protein